MTTSPNLLARSYYHVGENIRVGLARIGRACPFIAEVDARRSPPLATPWPVSINQLGVSKSLTHSEPAGKLLHISSLNGRIIAVIDHIEYANRYVDQCIIDGLRIESE